MRDVNIEKIREVNFTVGLSISWNSLSFTKLLPEALALYMLTPGILLRSVVNVVILVDPIEKIRLSLSVLNVGTL